MIDTLNLIYYKKDIKINSDKMIKRTFNSFSGVRNETRDKRKYNF